MPPHERDCVLELIMIVLLTLFMTSVSVAHVFTPACEQQIGQVSAFVLCWNDWGWGTLHVRYRPPSAMNTAHELSLHLIACWRIYYRASGGGGGVAPRERWEGEWEGVKQEERVVQTKKM